MVGKVDDIGMVTSILHHAILSLIMYFGVQVVKHYPWTSQVLVQMMHMFRGRICYNLTL
jgi:predicted phosphatase